jgi:hypothetical protein
VLYQVVHQTPVALRQLVDWPCSRVEAVLAKAMAKDRRDRYATILDFARAFEQAVAGDLAGDPHSRLTTPPPKKTVPSRPVVSDGDRSPVVQDRLDAREGATSRVRRPCRRRQATRKPWRRTAMVVSAACLAAATLAFGGAVQGRLSLTDTSGRMMAAYDSLTEGATKLWRQEFATATAADSR